MPVNDHMTCQLACCVTTQCRELVECFFLLLRNAKSAEFIEIFCFANFAIFHISFDPNLCRIKIFKKTLFFLFEY